MRFLSFFFNHPATPEIYTLSLHDALPIAIQGSNVPNPDEAVPSFVSGAMAKAGKGLLEGTLQAGLLPVPVRLLIWFGLGGNLAAVKERITGDFFAVDFLSFIVWWWSGAV